MNHKVGPFQAQRIRIAMLRWFRHMAGNPNLSLKKRKEILCIIAEELSTSDGRKILASDLDLNEEQFQKIRSFYQGGAVIP